jgi:hypothetical protein
VVLSVAFVPHATYFAEIAVPVGAFALAGGIRCVQLYRDARGRAWILLPAVILVEAAWSISISLAAPTSMRFVLVPVVVLGLVSATVLVLLRSRPANAVARVAVAAAVVGAVFAPVAWSLCVLGPGGGGSASDAFAGPRIVAASEKHLASTGQLHARPPTLRPPFRVPPAPALDPAQWRLLRYITAHNGSRRYAFATDSMPIAVNFLLDSSVDTLPMGGFSRRAPDPAAGSVQRLVSAGALRYVLLNSDSVAAQIGNPDVASTRAWVHEHCRPVLHGRFHVTSRLTQVLYDCATPRSSGPKP